ncbi:SRPBCC family protein [Pseudonocardia aurantiaca]|uniref:SRPBCC family protein n=1 Tax=Pseudonocardia aurantiaca TaxID=75290 RepID=A0ABW4FIG5_9PSEU
MIINSEFQVAAPVERVWAYFNAVPSLAPCLPGAELVGDDGNGTYEGKVVAALGPVKLNFSGTARITESDEAAHRLVLHASGAEDRGRGTADMTITAQLVPSGGGTTVRVAQDLTISGAAAQFGRGMIADVTSVLMASFAECVEHNITQAGSGGAVTAVRTARPASGFAIGVRAAVMALKRVFARFFLPYDVSRLR